MSGELGNGPEPGEGMAEVDLNLSEWDSRTLIVTVTVTTRIG